MSEEPSLYRIGVFARKAGVSARTVRYYDIEGLLSPRRRSVAGYRLYADDDFQRLRKILSLRQLDVPIETIRKVLEEDGIDTRTVLENQKARVAEEKDKLQRIESAILEAERMASIEGQIDWNAIFRIAESKYEGSNMTTFSLSKEQLRTAATANLYPNGKSRWRSAAPVVAGLGIVLIVAGSIVFRQYIGAGIAAAIGLFYTYSTVKLRQLSKRSDARTSRLASIPYRIDVLETHLQVEYDQTSFKLPYANLHITKQGSEYYSVMHELGLRILVPAKSIDENQRKILLEHISEGPIEWSKRTRAH